MKQVMTLVVALSLFAAVGCDKPNKSAGEHEGLGISGAASGKPTRDRSDSDREGEVRSAPPPSSGTGDKSR